MDGVLQFLLNALSLGSMYALMALGLVIVFGILRLVNFAYGELLMVAGYTLLVVQGGAGGVPWLFLAVLAVIVAGVVSILTERLAFRPVRSDSLNAMLVTSFAVSTLLQNSALLFVSPRPRALDIPSWLRGNVELGGLRLGIADVVTICVSLLFLAALGALFRWTTLGLSLRAAADDFRMLRLLGVRANVVIATAFAISGVLAGVVGVLWSARIGSVTPTIGSTPLLIALIAVVVGGMNGLSGAIVGGYLLGALTVGMQLLLPQEVLAFRDAFIFAIVIVLLVARPQGIVKGRYSAERVG